MGATLPRAGKPAYWGNAGIAATWVATMVGTVITPATGAYPSAVYWCTWATGVVTT